MRRSVLFSLLIIALGSADLAAQQRREVVDTTERLPRAQATRADLERELAAERGERHGIEVRIPPIRYCTDNGAMIAALGSAMLRSGVTPSVDGFPVDSSMPLVTVRA